MIPNVRSFGTIEVTVARVITVPRKRARRARNRSTRALETFAKQSLRPGRCAPFRLDTTRIESAFPHSRLAREIRGNGILPSQYRRLWRACRLPQIKTLFDLLLRTG